MRGGNFPLWCARVPRKLIVIAFVFVGLGCFFFMRSDGLGRRVEFSPAERAVHYQGRWDRSNPARPRASWPGFSLSTGFTGTSIALRMDDGENYYNVDIDEKFHGVVQAGRREGVVLLARDLSAGAHTLRLSRRNISFERPTTISGILLDEGGGLFAAEHESPRMKIEFIGDSYTAAEGNEASAATLTWKRKMPVSDSDQGFAAMVARDCHADYVTVCRSGCGAVSDWQGLRTEQMVERYDRALMDVAQPAWDFSRWTPDLVVVCLGINDYAGLRQPDGKVSADNSAAFRGAYSSLLDKVRGHYPGAQILALAPHVPWAREQVNQVVRERADQRVHYGQFDEFAAECYVADGHPTVATHRKIADQVMQQLTELKLAGS